MSQPWLVEAVGTARWRGISLRALLEEARVAAGAVEVVFTGLDRGVEGGVEQPYQRALALDEARREEVMLAYEMNGMPLPPQHGFPLRLVVPGWYGMTSVKWLARIDVVDRPFAGYQQALAYRLRQAEGEPGEPLSWIEPRSLVAPPGIPEFLTRERTLAAGPVLLEGRAWSGRAPVEAVEVSVDGGATWHPADLDPDELGSSWAWRRWTFTWDASPGSHVVGSRARDGGGNVQPAEPHWNLGGYANNAVQWVRVSVPAVAGA